MSTSGRSPLLLACVAVALGVGLAGVPARAKVPAKMPEDKVRGRELYQDLCWQCHGAEGEGDGPVGLLLGKPPLSLRGREAATWPELLVTIQQGRGDMPAYSATLDRADSRRILAWLAALDAGDTAVGPTRSVPGPPAAVEPVEGQVEAEEPPAE